MDHLHQAAQLAAFGKRLGISFPLRGPALWGAVGASIVGAGAAYRLLFVPIFRRKPAVAPAPVPMPRVEPAPEPQAAPAPEPLVIDSEEKRQALLKTHRDIIAALGNAPRTQCALLALDVVGSTKMKSGQEESKIAATFAAYRAFVERVLAEHECWKQTWTPDGVMSCFLSRDLALAAGQAMLRGLKEFNERGNGLTTPFRVRGGMNEGPIAVFPDSALETVADRVIDVAGHMQKDARPDTLWVTDFMYREIDDKRGFRATAKFVDGYEAYEWAIRD